MRTAVRRSPAAAFVLTTFAISWGLWGVGLALASRPLRIDDPAFLPFLVAGSFGPTLGALAVTALWGGGAAVRDLLRRLVRFRVHPAVYLAVFALLPATFVVVYLVAGLRPAATLPLPAVILTMVVASPVNAAFALLTGAGPLGEELGWRGMLLPLLAERFSDVRAATLVGVVWAVWHWPLAVFPDWRVATSVPVWLVGYTAGMIGLSILFTTVWRWGRGSVLVTIVLHAVVNTSAQAAAPGGLWDLDDLSADQSFVLVNIVFWVAAGAAALLGRTVRRMREPAEPRDAFAIPAAPGRPRRPRRPRRTRVRLHERRSPAPAGEAPGGGGAG